MEGSRLLWFWAIIVAFTLLAVPASAERGEKPCKQKTPAEPLCCRVVTIGDHHPPHRTTLKEATDVWKTLWEGVPDMKNYRLDIKDVRSPKKCRLLTH